MFETIQSRLVFAFALILLIMNVVSGYVMYGKMMGSLMVLIVVLIGLPLALLFAYDINCLIVGNCNVWSWIRTLLYVLFSVLSVVIIIQLMVRKEKKELPEEKKEEKKEKKEKK